MKLKFFEILDRMTFVPALAIDITCKDDLSDAEVFLIRSGGYSFDLENYDNKPCIILMRLSDTTVRNNWALWDDRTMSYSHKYIQANWGKLESGSIIDVEFILGETEKPKNSERFSYAYYAL